METTEPLAPAGILGAGVVTAMRRARDFLRARSTAELLPLVGTVRAELALQAPAAGRSAFPLSYGGGGTCAHDLLAGLGMFYVSESGEVVLDCTSGHYQMTWGYNHPALTSALDAATELGIVWDNHSNIPSIPVRHLADALAALGREAGLDRVLLGVCTGSVACAAALKVMLARYRADHARSALGPPVFIALTGNYHGTDILAQTLRGMWPGLVSGAETVQLEPNDEEQLREAFRRFGRRVAGFWAEPIMMNREAIGVRPDYLRLARALCDECGALMALDEIQTGFWYPEVLYFRRADVAPDMVIVGKGMTAGFHPLSAMLFRHELDVLEQYDAISTNGNASLAALLALCNLRMIADDAPRIGRLARRHHECLCALAADFPELIEGVNGDGFLTGMRFRARDDALGFHKAALARGLWLRAHAYHPGHRTVLMKYPLVIEDAVIDFVLAQLRDLCSAMPWR
ncbi:MAG: aminotransferase class III-fold pyridoxal phosphate-dependent enzyme [Candidatus Brocadiaceae bacterium]|nr:aminotransferase class III-fold pyridoxal phosphate-dependent enzyme [Candidatus Brocadiaceae bacterium]